MKKHRTSKKNRTTFAYIYLTDEKLELIPGKDGVTEAFIEILHSFDDEECRQQHNDTRNDRKYKLESTASIEELDEGGVWIPSDDKNPLDILIEEESNETLHAAIKKLPEAQQEAILAVWIEGMSASEYATSTGKNKSVVSRTLSRAMDNLKTVLSEK